MPSRALGAFLALAAAVAIVVSIASSAWWAGAPVVEGKQIDAKYVHAGPLGATGCNVGGDGSCEPVTVEQTVQLVGYGALGAAGLATLFLFVLLSAALRVSDRRRGIAAASMLFTLLAAGGAGALLALGPGIKASQHVDVPIGWGTFAFGGGILASLIASLITRKLEPEPLRLKPSLTPVPGQPVAKQSKRDIRAALRESQQDLLRPSTPELRGAAPGPQLRPLYDPQNAGIVPAPHAPHMPSRAPTPLPREAIGQLLNQPPPQSPPRMGPSTPALPPQLGASPPPADVPYGRAVDEPVNPYARTSPPSDAPPLRSSSPRIRPPQDNASSSPRIRPPHEAQQPADASGRMKPPTAPPGDSQRMKPPTAPPGDSQRMKPPTAPPGDSQRMKPPTAPPGAKLPGVAPVDPLRATMQSPPPSNSQRAKPPTAPPSAKLPSVAPLDPLRAKTPSAGPPAKLPGLPPATSPGDPLRAKSTTSPPADPLRAKSSTNPPADASRAKPPTAPPSRPSAPKLASSTLGDIPRTKPPSIPPVRPVVPTPGPPRKSIVVPEHLRAGTEHGTPPPTQPVSRASQPAIPSTIIPPTQSKTIAHAVPPMPAIDGDARRAQTENDSSLDEAMRATDFVTAVEIDHEAKAAAQAAQRAPAPSDDDDDDDDGADDTSDDVSTSAPKRADTDMRTGKNPLAPPPVGERTAVGLLAAPPAPPLRFGAGADFLRAESPSESTLQTPIPTREPAAPGAEPAPGGIDLMKTIEMGGKTPIPTLDRVARADEPKRPAHDEPKRAVQVPISTAPTTLPPPKQLDPAPSGPTPACPQCESPMAWVDEHLRFYCRACRMYF